MKNGIYAVDWFVDVFFICDLMLNFRTAYVNFDGTLEIEPLKVRWHYIRSWFLIDLVASIPFEKIAGGAQGTTALALAKMPRLLRLSRLLKKLDMFTSARAMRVFSVLIFFLIFTHFVGCFWWLVGVSQRENGWQFQPDVVPILLQDVNWLGESRLVSEPRMVPMPWIPTWLPDL